MHTQMASREGEDHGDHEDSFCARSCGKQFVGEKEDKDLSCQRLQKVRNNKKEWIRSSNRFSPDLSIDQDLNALKSALDVYQKEVQKIGLEMTNLKKTHNYIFEGNDEELKMESFEATLEWTICEVWQKLQEGYEPN